MEMSGWPRHYRDFTVKDVVVDVDVDVDVDAASQIACVRSCQR